MATSETSPPCPGCGAGTAAAPVAAPVAVDEEAIEETPAVVEEAEV
jgi:hypothetical protein